MKSPEGSTGLSGGGRHGGIAYSGLACPICNQSMRELDNRREQWLAVKSSPDVLLSGFMSE